MTLYMRDKGLIDDEDGTSTLRPNNYKAELDRKANRSGKQRSRISLDQFLAQSDGLGAKTNLNDT
jgi:hypothetical protein